MKTDSFDCAVYDRNVEARQLALILDTEGSLSASLNDCVPIIAVEMKHEKFPLYCYKHLGGYYNPESKKNNSNGTYFRWCVNGGPCRRTLDITYNYLQLKRGQAEVVYALLNLMKGPGNRYTDRERVKRYRYVQFLQKLNA